MACKIPTTNLFTARFFSSPAQAACALKHKLRRPLAGPPLPGMPFQTRNAIRWRRWKSIIDSIPFQNVLRSGRILKANAWPTLLVKRGSGASEIGTWRPSQYACLAVITTAFILSGCSPTVTEPVPGPDKQGAGTVYGALLGAGTGAITAAQASVATGPGAWVGAGFGGVFGLFSGLGIDLLEEDQLNRKEEFQRLRLRAWAHEMMQEHYERRLTLHPSRDIFPADLFFQPDSAELRPEGKVLIQEIAQLTRVRTPSSRILVTSYVTASDPDSPFASTLNEKRSEELGVQLVRCGVEARRVVTQGVVLDVPLLVDPDDAPGRYRQAIELLPMDR